jgi:hypothetical protein
MNTWITPDGAYYVGDWVAEGSLPVPPRPDIFHDWDGGAWVVNLGRKQAHKLIEVNAAFEVAAKMLTAGYPESEKDSWPDQKNEAMAWHADNATPTPYLDLLASYRGIDPQTYREKTVAKVLAYTGAAAFLIGTRQKYADQIGAASDAAAVDAIVPNFSYPT